MIVISYVLAQQAIPLVAEISPCSGTVLYREESKREVCQRVTGDRDGSC